MTRSVRSCPPLDPDTHPADTTVARVELLVATQDGTGRCLAVPVDSACGALAADLAAALAGCRAGDAGCATATSLEQTREDGVLRCGGQTTVAQAGFDPLRPVHVVAPTP